MYEIYIGELKLPLLPESLKEGMSKDNKRYDILASGEVIRPGRVKLKSWSIESTFEHEKIDVKKARDYLYNLAASETEGIKPVRFIVNRYKQDGALTFDTNCLVLIESLEFEDKAGEVADISYSLKLAEYKPFGGKMIK